MAHTVIPPPRGTKGKAEKIDLVPLILNHFLGGAQRSSLEGECRESGMKEEAMGGRCFASIVPVVHMCTAQPSIPAGLSLLRSKNNM